MVYPPSRLPLAMESRHTALKVSRKPAFCAIKVTPQLLKAWVLVLCRHAGLSRMVNGLEHRHGYGGRLVLVVVEEEGAANPTPFRQHLQQK